MVLSPLYMMRHAGTGMFARCVSHAWRARSDVLVLRLAGDANIIAEAREKYGADAEQDWAKNWERYMA